MSQNGKGLVLPSHVAQQVAAETQQEADLFVTVPAAAGTMLVYLESIKSGGRVMSMVPVIAFNVLVHPNGMAKGGYLPIPMSSQTPEVIVGRGIKGADGVVVDAETGRCYRSISAWCDELQAAKGNAH